MTILQYSSVIKYKNYTIFIHEELESTWIRDIQIDLVTRWHFITIFFIIFTSFVAFFFLSKNDFKHSMQPECSRSTFLSYLPVSGNLRMPVDCNHTVVTFILEIRCWWFPNKMLIKCSFVQEYFQKLLMTRMHLWCNIPSLFTESSIFSDLGQNSLTSL